MESNPVRPLRMLAAFKREQLRGSSESCSWTFLSWWSVSHRAGKTCLQPGLHHGLAAGIVRSGQGQLCELSHSTALWEYTCLWKSPGHAARSCCRPNLTQGANSDSYLPTIIWLHSVCSLALCRQLKSSGNLGGDLTMLGNIKHLLPRWLCICPQL